MSERMKKRFEGCLIGGAVGDALGYPVEFLTERQIFSGYGENGIRTLEEAGHPAVISDDTQMTLFASSALICHRKHPESDWIELLRTAYREWYVTQTGDESLLTDGKPQMEIYYEKRLHKKRAPGNTCLNAIRSYIEDPEIRYAKNNSKGCGTVMRAAPYGLARRYDPAYSYGDAGKPAHIMSTCDAMLTHGHEDARNASATLAEIVFNIVHYFADRTDQRLQDVIETCLGLWKPDSCVRKAIPLAEDAAVDDLTAIHQLGEGWVADEALAIAIFCAVRYQNDFSKAIRAAVNHHGDSDSTGAICGNILGAWLGIDAVKTAFDLNYLEMRELIVKTADELYRVTAVDAPEGEKIPAKEVPMNKIELIHASCADQTVDVVVNAANRDLWAGGGICGVIFSKAGLRELSAACRKYATPLKDGAAVITPAFNMKNAKAIIHAVGPDFGKTPTAWKALFDAYYHSLQVMMEHGYHRIAFPLISSGIFGGALENPAGESAKQCVRAYRRFISDVPDYGVDVKLCAFSASEMQKAQEGFNALSANADVPGDPDPRRELRG